jgi:hypothetical protein
VSLSAAHQDPAAAYTQLSQFDDAVSQLRAALKLSPNSAQLHYNLGLAFKTMFFVAVTNGEKMLQTDTALRLCWSPPMRPKVTKD